MAKILTKIVNEFLDCLYPQGISCLNCGEELKENGYLCQNCLNNFTIINNACKKCGNPVNAQTQYCDDCKGKNRHFDLAISPYEYCGTAQSLIYKLKYNGERYIAKVFAQSLVDCFLKAKIKNIDFVTCVPLNEERKKERSYNQAEEIAKHFVEKLKEKGINLEEKYNIISRVKNTPTQTALTKRERQENLKGAFKLVCNKKEIENKNVLIIDDIFTTGATMEELSKVLKKARVKGVYCLTVCHTNINRLHNN